MPSPSNASDWSSAERRDAARDLYLRRGAAEACSRCEANAQFGTRDLAAEVLRHLELRPGDTVLDVGCGSGQHLLRFAQAVAPGGQALGFDFSPEAVAAARARGARAEVSDAAALPVPDASAQALACTFAVYYLADLGRALAEWRRVLQARGPLVNYRPAPDTNPQL
jgi:ubiquinone/menaquinone biosynthesis C-methylase UbiE